ncbi:GHKL domain-containing protein, partial [bacterium]|nr:GHKL domain-containing protein [bacterium]
NEHRQAVLANRKFYEFTAELDGLEVLGRRPGEILHCIHASESHDGCGTTEFCSTCGAAQAVISSLKGIQAEEECRITLSTDVEQEALDLRVWTSPFVYENESFTLFSLLDISDEKRRMMLEHIFFHDVLNTAGVLLGFTDLARQGKIDRNNREGFHTLHSHTKDLIEQIHTHRDLKLAETGELEVKPTPFGTRHFLQDLLHTYSRLPQAKGIVIDLDHSLYDVTIESDKRLLKRVLGNMIKNAVEASVRGDTVSLGCRRADPYIVFSVHNRGYIPRDIQLQLFKRSFSTKGDGRGYGAYSMKLLTETYLDGKVGFATSKEDGTEFQACLPLTEILMEAEYAPDERNQGNRNHDSESGAKRTTRRTWQLSSELRDRLPSLLIALEKRLLLQWERVQRYFIMSDMKLFSDEIARLLHEYPYPTLDQWHTRFDHAVEQFDMTTLPGLLSHFPEIIEEIRRINEGGGDLPDNSSLPFEANERVSASAAEPRSEQDSDSDETEPSAERPIPAEQKRSEGEASQKTDDDGTPDPLEKESSDSSDTQEVQPESHPPHRRSFRIEGYD